METLDFRVQLDLKVAKVLQASLVPLVHLDQRVLSATLDRKDQQEILDLKDHRVQLVQQVQLGLKDPEDNQASTDHPVHQELAVHKVLLATQATKDLQDHRVLLVLQVPLETLATRAT